MVSTKILLSLFVFLAVTESYPQHKKQKQDHLVYPDQDTNLNRTATHSREPVIDLKKCEKDSELLYPGDNEADWVCDCKPGYLFYPLTQKCYPAYRQGPCSSGQYLILSGNSKVPKCQENPCREDGMVLFQNGCVHLNQPDSCKYYEMIIGRPVKLIVDPTTLEFICSDEYENVKCTNNCCIGSARHTIQNCEHDQKQRVQKNN